MPFNLAQWTGIAVTIIVVSGTDMDVVYAVPLGLFAGALATFFSALADRYRPESGYHTPPAIALKDAPRSKKLG
jgi:hypothetical protein